MVISRPQFRRSRNQGAFALAELMIATAIFAMTSAALIMSFISLKRSYAATTDFAINHADQMRISDYLALDFRRAIKVDPPAQNNVSIYIPAYYDTTPSHNVQTPVLDGKGGVYYGAADASVNVRYYLEGSVIYRKEGTAAPVALAEDVKDFVINTTDLGKVIKTSITFKPTFRRGVISDEIAQGTAFYNITMLRNNRGVY